MKTVCRILVVAWWVLTPSTFLWADDDEAARRWERVKASLQQGAYRDALESLDRILAVSPDDARARRYRTLAERRLKGSSKFPQLAPAELESLTARLEEEERMQRRASAQQQAIDRELRKEGERWEQELEAQQRGARDEEERRRREAAREAGDRVRAEREQQRQAEQQQRDAEQKRREAEHARQRDAERQARQRPPEPAPEPRRAKRAEAPSPPAAVSPPTPVSPPVPVSPPAPVSPPPTEPLRAASPAVTVDRKTHTLELAPVVVTTPPPEPPPEAPPTPSLVGRELPPPGGVQINADQMRFSPDRKVAFAEGNVEVLFENTYLTCDSLTLFTDTHDVYAEGRVRIEEGTQVFRGEMAQYNVDTKKGRFLQGTISNPPWHQHGRTVEHLAEGVYQVTPGYLTSCDHEPPHFKFAGPHATVFTEDKIARMRHPTLIIEDFPFIYLPWLSVADRQTPFFIIPGKKKPWEQFVLSGYRYEWPEGHQGTLRMDWRRAFDWAFGADHRFETEAFGKGLLKVYYAQEDNKRLKPADTPKGADKKRYRVLWRHIWEPLEGTTVVTNIDELSDANLRQDFFLWEEVVREDNPETFVSIVKNTDAFTVTGLARKRMNRFETVTEAFPELSVSTRSQRLGDSALYSGSALSFANRQTRIAHSERDTDAITVTWDQTFNYAMSLFRPIEVTPSIGIQQAYHTKDKQGGEERPDGERDVLSGQFSTGADASLKLFRLFPLTTNAWGLNINHLRHVVTPTVAYSYIRRPTVPNSNLSFGSAGTPKNVMTIGIEHKLQTKRSVRAAPAAAEAEAPEPEQGALTEDGGGLEAEQGQDKKKPGMRSVDLARLLISVPYTFRGHHNKEGGELGDWAFDLELFPWPWLRLETSWSVPTHFVKGSRDERITSWNTDLVVVGGAEGFATSEERGVQAPRAAGFEPGAKGALTALLLPQGQWYLGLGHRYSHDDKTETVVQYDWRPSPKWEISTYHRLTWKERATGSVKRFNNVREYQYAFRRDLHDWIAEVVYRVDRELGEELFFTLTLKAYPEFPVEIGESYHAPKIGSQSSPFSPLRGQVAP